jgi:K+-sensing histidine kinase KdpD
LERFAFIASHDLKSPLNNIISLTFLLKDNFGNLMDEEGVEYLKFINDSAYKLSDLVTAILDYSKSSLLDVEKRDQVKIGTLLDEVVNGFNFPEKVKVQYSKDEHILNVSKPILKLILQNLVLFLVHNNTNDQVLIKINFHELKDKYIIDVLDNGSGLTTERKDKLFDLVHSLKQHPNSEFGIGLPLVKRLLDKLRGGILVQSELGKGTSFVFTIAK